MQPRTIAEPSPGRLSGMLARVSQAEQLAAQAGQWQAAGRHDMAAQLYATAVDQDPSKFGIRLKLAECLAALGQPDPATEQYLMVAQAYAARGRHAECLALCTRVIDIAPHAFVYMSVGPMVRRIGRHARALCARAAEAHLAAGRQTDGLQILRLGAELDPHNPDVRRQLARIYQSRHMKREAVEALSEAANLLSEAKRFDDFVEVARQILAIEPHDVNTLRELPRVYLELAKPHEAVRVLGQLTQASPGDIVGYEILAQAFAFVGRTDKALSVLGRLVEELGSGGQADKADTILTHARYWRPTDLAFLRALKDLEVPRPTSVPRPDPALADGPRPEGTVVLSIADLMLDESSRRAPAPSADEGVQLTEAEGTLTLRLADLMLDEIQQSNVVHAPSDAVTLPPTSRPPQPPASHNTIALDASDLIEAVAAVSPSPAEARPSEPEMPAVSPPTQAPGPEDPATVAFSLSQMPDMPAASAPPAAEPPIVEPPIVPPPTVQPPLPVTPSDAPPRPVSPAMAPLTHDTSMSELIYDDDDDETETPTLLHMKPLTAEDIARAQKRLAEGRAPMAPPVVQPPGGDELEAPTMANLPPVTAADIARSLSKASAQAPVRRGPGVDDQAVTHPPEGAPRPVERMPTAPPLLTAPAAVENDIEYEDEDEDEMTVTRMTALTPADIERALRKQRGDSD